MSAQFFVSLVTMLVALQTILLACAYLILLERKVAAWAQDRLGPNRTNFSFGVLPFKGTHGGLGQALADGAKLFFKEDYTPPHVDRALFLLAPVLVMIPAIIGWAVIPWGGTWDFPGLTLPLIGEIEPARVSVAGAPISVALIYLLAVGSLGVYGVVLGAYASNNKYSFLGGIRATAQMVSYEIPMGLCVLIVILTFQTTDAGLLSNLQAGSGSAGIWGIFMHPLLAIIFFTCVLAECNRAPFDLAESEQDLVGGFHTEYSAMKWALFFLAEYMHMITGAAFFCLLFLGGWDLLPFVAVLPTVADAGWAGVLVVLLKVGVFVGKVVLLIWVMMWIRWTLPRFRFDQLMRLTWRGLIPTCILVLLLSTLVVFAEKMAGWESRWITAGLLLLSNIAAVVIVTVIGPMIPGNAGGEINRRVGLEGSRFSPA
jgi:NADH-quinone oxidoreductase subunit H